MDSCYTADHTAGDHIHTDITTCNTKRPKQKYHLGNVSKWLLRRLKILYLVHCILTIYKIYHTQSNCCRRNNLLALMQL